MSFLDHAIKLARMGFHVFPLAANSKLPTDFMEGFPKKATRDEKKLREWWIDPVMGLERPYNVGISTTRFADDSALIVVDVDDKEGRRGYETLFELELQGKLLPPTFTQKTPSGGTHYFYKTPKAKRQGVNVLGPGIDIRSYGGLVVGIGSIIPSGTYVREGDHEIREAPKWIVELLKDPEDQKKISLEEVQAKLDKVDEKRAVERAILFLSEDAPIAIEGQGGNTAAYKTACKLKDFGLSPVNVYRLMSELWNDRCIPPWSEHELQARVKHAFKYGKNEPGYLAPELDFDEVPEEKKELHPFKKMNEEYAFVLAGGGHHILWESKDIQGRAQLRHLDEGSFHKKFAAHVMSIGDGRTKPVTELWIKSADRRSYKGLCFRPEQPTPKDWYNLWKGFAVKPIEKLEQGSAQAKESLKRFLDHSLENICQGDAKLHQWLIGYFAHLVQKPWEKPLTALVFRGKKGVGKNALIDRVGYLLGSHYLVTSNRRYLVGNFNSHFENCLLLTLDEAFWSGDKQAEGILKDLITGSKHVIEHKGKETYQVENCTRVVIIGNEDWLVPASHDERRFAVFDVGSGKKQQRKYFQEMREWMEQGGYALLLRYLKDFPIDDLDINHAPSTAALHDQKLASLSPFELFWRDSLAEGRILMSDFESEWKDLVPKKKFREAYHRYAKEHRMGSWFLSDTRVTKKLKELCPTIKLDAKFKAEEGWVHAYQLPDLSTARKAWESYIGHAEKWF